MIENILATIVMFIFILEGLPFILKQLWLLPIVRVKELGDSNGRNNYLMVYISPKIPSNQSHRGVVYQEIAESRINNGALISLYSSSKIGESFRRKLECRGKMLEILIAHTRDDFDFDDYLETEARSLYQNPTYPQFKGYSVENIEQEILNQKQWAQDFYNKYHKKIDKIFDKKVLNEK